MCTDRRKTVCTGNNSPHFLDEFAVSFNALLRLPREFSDFGSHLFPAGMSSWILKISPMKISSLERI
jgi:hypothetical protein